MKTQLKNLIALTALAIMAGSLDNTYATNPNHWTLVGPSAGGGFIIVGSGPIDLGRLTPFTSPVFMSPGGSDIVTLNAGSTASSNGVTIDLETPGNVLNNHGSIIALGSGVGVDEESTGNAVFNWGSIQGNNEGVVFDGNFNSLANWGSVTSLGYGVYFFGPSNTASNWGSISSSGNYAVYMQGNFNTLNNWGSVFSASNDGIHITGQSSTVNNYGPGTISGVNYGIYVNTPSDNSSNNILINNRGMIAGTDPANGIGVRLESYSTLNNWGMISGGRYGVELFDQHNTFTNYAGGMVTGNTRALYIDDFFQKATNWGTLATPSSAEAVIYDNGDDLNVITNHGYILGNGATAVILNNCNGDTINLLGHSVVIGKIQITGGGNVVNFNLTGLSPAKITSLNNILIPQGVNSGNVISSVVFNLNGVNYNIDPAIVNFHASSYQLQALTPNQSAIGASLDSLNSIPTPGEMALFNAVDASGNVPAALDALSPASYAIYGDLAIENTTALVQGVDRRLDNLRDGSESVDTTGIGGDNTVGLTSGYSKDDSKDKVVKTAPAENRWGFFASASGLFFRGGQGTGLQGGKSNTAGALVGLDGKVGEHAVIGTFFAYDNSAVTLGGAGGSATIQSYSGGIYGAYHQDGFYVNSLAAYTRNDYKSTRAIAFPGFALGAAGSTSGNQASVNIDGGYDWHLTDRVTLGPIAGLQYVHLDVDGFNETGAGAAGLAVGSQSMDSLQSRLGARAAYHLATSSNTSASVELYAAWQHEYLEDSRGIGATFEGGGLAPFSVQTASPRRDAAVVGTAVNVTFKNRITLFADYELQMWQSNQFEQSINGGAKISW